MVKDVDIVLLKRLLIQFLILEEKEVEVAVDIYKMMASSVSFRDIQGAISNGNTTMSAGNFKTSGQRRTIRILGEIENPKELENFVVKSENGDIVYLKDVATVSFKEKDRTTFAREYGNQVVMLDVKKRSGKNMVAAAEKIESIVAQTQANVFPSNLQVNITNDQSSKCQVLNTKRSSKRNLLPASCCALSCMPSAIIGSVGR